MLKAVKISGTVKEIYFVGVTFLTFLFSAQNRAYLAFLFHQLDSPESLIVLRNEEKSTLAAFASLLSPLGCLLAGVCFDLIGRKHTLQLVYMPFIISWGIITYAESVEVLYIAFLLQGIGSGMAFCSITYISEICSAKYRGSLFVILLINYNCGILLCNFLMYILKWNMVALILTGASIFVLMLTSFLPESPVWLYSKGKKEQSIKTLCFIRSKEALHLESEIQDLEKYCSTKKTGSLIETLRNCARAWRQLVLLLLVFFFGANSGHVTITVFGIIMLNSLELPYDSTQIFLIYSTVGPLTCFLTPFVMHKFKRRTVLAATSLGMSLCLLMIVLYREFINNETFVWIVPTFLCIYIFFASVGLIPICFLMGGELLPADSRGVLSGIHGSLGYLYLSGLQKLFPWFLSEFGIITSLSTISFCCFTMTLFVIFILPETKGRTLNQIQEEYFRKKKTNDSP